MKNYRVYESYMKGLIDRNSISMLLKWWCVLQCFIWYQHYQKVSVIFMVMVYIVFFISLFICHLEERTQNYKKNVIASLLEESDC